MCEVVAIDALSFRKDSTKQFCRYHIDREIRKAFTGFKSSLPDKPHVATGNWGCGAFKGNLELKC